MSGILLLIVAAVAAIRVMDWWSKRDLREQEVAAMEAIALHTRPILIRSQFIGDAEVEHRFEMVRQRIELADNGFLTSADVYKAIYNTRTKNGRAFIDFEQWADLEEEKHRQRVYQWEVARAQSMQVKGQEKIGLSKKGERVFNGQRDPRMERFEIEF